MGYEAGYSNTGAVEYDENEQEYYATGAQNVFLGYQAGRSNTVGMANVYLGSRAGYSLKEGASNVFIGNNAGYYTGMDGYTAYSNVFIGTSAGGNNKRGSGNIAIGLQALSTSVVGASRYGSGGSNIAIGAHSGSKHMNGDGNIFLGHGAGYENVSGFNNVFIGYTAGWNETGSNRLHISVSETISETLIYGEFDNKRVAINTNNCNSKTFYVNGTAGGTSAWSSSSDRRLKTNIRPLESALAKVMKLNGVNFRWKDETNHRPGNNVGFIAQEVLEVLPEVVSGGGKDENGNEVYYSIEYGSVVPVLVEAIKELKAEKDELKQQVDELKKLVEQLLKK